MRKPSYDLIDMEWSRELLEREMALGLLWEGVLSISIAWIDTTCGILPLASLKESVYAQLVPIAIFIPLLS